MLESVGAATQRVVETYDRRREASDLADGARNAVAAAAAAGAGAVGLGTLVAVAASTAAADVTGIILGEPDRGARLLHHPGKAGAGEGHDAAQDRGCPRAAVGGAAEAVRGRNGARRRTAARGHRAVPRGSSGPKPITFAPSTPSSVASAATWAPSASASSGSPRRGESGVRIRVRGPSPGPNPVRGPSPGSESGAREPAERPNPRTRNHVIVASGAARRGWSGAPARSPG